MRWTHSCLSALLVVACLPVNAATIGGTLYNDLNRNGQQDAGEQPLAGITVQLQGAEGTVNESVVTVADGSYAFASLGDGDYIVAVPAVSQLRASLPSQAAETAPISNFPFGLPRYSGMARTVTNLDLFGQSASTYLHMALGDSIGFGFSVCGSLLGGEGYIEPVTDRLARATATDVEVAKQAIPGHESADLLIPGLGPDFPLFFNDIFRAIDRGSALVSISIGGNDFLGPDGGGDPALAAALVDARRNIQEILSTLQTELPFADIEINTVYDPEEGDNALYNTWVPIWNQVLRETAWGQVRRVTIAEAYRDFAHDTGGTIFGEPGLVCNDIFGLDGIHPTVPGYDVLEEKLWQAFGGITLAGGADRLDVDLGFQRSVPVGQATSFSDISGTAQNPQDAIGFDNNGALISADSAEFRVQGFAPQVPPGVEAQAAVIKVRYRTTGAPLDDYYVIEASLDGTFSAPGSTPSTWNTLIPLVGSAGNDGAERLAFPDQPDYRVVSAALYTGAPVDGSGAVSLADLATLSVRVVTTAVGPPDAYAVELDGAFVEIVPVPASRVREAAVSKRSTANASRGSQLASRPDTDALLAQLADPQKSRQARQQLAKRTDAVPGLISATRSGLARTRAGAAWALGAFPARAERLLPALRPLSADPEPAVRLAALDARSRLGDGQALPEIVALASEPRYRVDAARALGRYDQPAAMRELLAIVLADDSGGTAQRTAARLLALSGPAAVPALRQLLEHPRLRVRRIAASGLARFADNQAGGPL